MVVELTNTIRAVLLTTKSELEYLRLATAFLLCALCASASMAKDAGSYAELLFQRDFVELSRVEESLRSDRELSDQDRTKLELFYREVGGYRLTSDDEWKKREQLIQEWIEVQPESDAAILAMGFHYYRYGWYRRGTSVANELEMTQVVPFKDYMRRALVRALSAAEVAGDDPAWWELMLGVAVAQSWPKPIFNVIYEQAVDKFPWYLPYHIFKSQYVSRRWYGSHEQLADFTETSASRFSEYFGNRLYGRLQWQMRLNDMFDNGQTQWPLVHESFESIVAEYPERENYIHFAILACLAKDTRTLKTLLPRVEPPPEPAEWSTRHFKYCRNLGERYVMPAPDSSSAERELSKVQSGVDHETQIATIYKLADTNVNIADLIKEYGFVLRINEWVEVAYRVAKLDVDRGLALVDRHALDRRAAYHRIASAYRQRLGEGYADWVWDYPVLWKPEDVDDFFKDENKRLPTMRKIESFKTNQKVFRERAFMVLARTDPSTLLAYIKDRNERWNFSRSSEQKLMVDTVNRIAVENDDVFRYMAEQRVLIPLTDLQALIESVGKQNPESVATYLDTLGVLDVLPIEYVSSMIRPVLIAWVKEDDAKVLNWARTIERDDMKDRVLFVMGRHHEFAQEPDMERALAYYRQIGDFHTRQGLIIQIMPWIYSQDPDMFETLADELELDAVMIEDFKQSARSL